MLEIRRYAVAGLDYNLQVVDGGIFTVHSKKGGIHGPFGTSAPAYQGEKITPLSKFGELLQRRRFLNNQAKLNYYMTNHKVNTVGSDPEFFIFNDKALVPAFQVLPDKKHHSYYWDGFQGEFTTLTNACLQLHGCSLQSQLLAVYKHVRKTLPNPSISVQDVVQLPLEEMQTFKDEHVMFGCDPSYHVYGDTGMLTADPRKLPLRFAGGHIHFGIARPSWHPTAQEIAPFVMALDKFLGVWSVGAAASLEPSKQRRQYYGLAGEFRLPSHGLEYRTLGPFWLGAPEIYYITFELARIAYRAQDCGFMDFWFAPQAEVQHAINNYDVELARRILRKNEKMFLRLVSGARNFHVSDKNAKRAFQVGMEGVESVIPEPGNVIKNWRLKEILELGRETRDHIWGIQDKDINSGYRTWNALTARL